MADKKIIKLKRKEVEPKMFGSKFVVNIPSSSKLLKLHKAKESTDIPMTINPGNVQETTNALIMTVAKEAGKAPMVVVPLSTKEKIKKLSPRHLKLAKIINTRMGNSGKKGGSYKSMIVEAGFSPNTADSNAKGILQPIRDSGILDPVLDNITGAIEKLAAAVNDPHKIAKQNPYQNSLTMDVMVKNKQLLTGKATSREVLDVELSDEQLAAIASKVQKKKN